MAQVDIVEWTPEHVTEWLQGIDEAVWPHIESFLNFRINGSKLLMMTANDLARLHVKKVNTQEIILDAIDLLRQLNYATTLENLQLLSLKSACESRGLSNHLNDELNSPKVISSGISNNEKNYDDFTKVDSASQLNCIRSGEQRVSLPTLSNVSNILDNVKLIINWLDRYPFVGLPLYSNIRRFLLVLSIELASTAQRDQFVEQPNSILNETAKRLADHCYCIVQGIDDSLVIQPTYLDVVTIKKKPDEEFGMVLKQLNFGVHLIEQVLFQSPSHRSGRISEGDEIVQVNYQTVAGWTLNNVIGMIRKFSTETILTIRKRPSHSNISNQISIIKPYQIQLRKIQSTNISLEHQDTSHNDTDSFRSSDQDRPIARERKHSTLDGDEILKDYADIAAEMPKEPKGPVYELNGSSTDRMKKRQLKRRASISGSIVSVGDLSQDSMNVASAPTANRTIITKSNSPTSTLSRVSKDPLAKSVSNDPTRLYLHTLSIDRSHLWMDHCHHLNENHNKNDFAKSNYQQIGTRHGVIQDEDNNIEILKQKNTTADTFVYPNVRSTMSD